MDQPKMTIESCLNPSQHQEWDGTPICLTPLTQLMMFETSS
jgi:hypothetical protein